MGVRAKALRVAHYLTVATESIGALLLLGIVIINFLQVFYRYVLFDPLGWTEETMRYSVLRIILLPGQIQRHAPPLLKIRHQHEKQQQNENDVDQGRHAHQAVIP